MQATRIDTHPACLTMLPAGGRLVGAAGRAATAAVPPLVAARAVALPLAAPAAPLSPLPAAAAPSIMPAAAPAAAGSPAPFAAAAAPPPAVAWRCASLHVVPASVPHKPAAHRPECH